MILNACERISFAPFEEETNRVKESYGWSYFMQDLNLEYKWFKLRMWTWAKHSNTIKEFYNINKLECTEKCYFLTTYDLVVRNMYLGKKRFGLNVHEDNRNARCLRSINPSMGSRKGVLQVVVTGTTFIRGFWQQQKGVKVARVRNRQHLLHSSLPRIRHVAIIKWSSL